MNVWQASKMTYIKQNVNYVLLFIILGLTVLVAISAVFFNTNLQQTAQDLSTTEKQIETLKKSLTIEIAKLSTVESQLDIQQERESGLSSQYKEVKSTTDKLQSDKASLVSNIDKKETEIAEYQKKGEDCASDKLNLDKENRELYLEIKRIQNEANSYAAQLDDCQESS